MLRGYQMKHEKYATSNEQLIIEMTATNNIVTKNTIENILLGRSERGDHEAMKLLYKYLKGF